LSPLLFLSAGSRQHGVGHLRRSLELADVCRERGMQVTTAALIRDRETRGCLSDIIAGYDLCVQSLNDLYADKASGVLVDVHTDLQQEVFIWLQKKGKPVFALDWYHDTSDVIVEIANLRGGTDQLKYAIIRQEFVKARRDKGILGQTYDAAVVMGGADNRKHLSRVCRCFWGTQFFAGRKIIVVLGQMVDEKAIQPVEPSTVQITIVKTPNNVAEIMANASVGITNGGTALMEFSMLGIPAIIFPQSKQEDEFSQVFLERGAAVLGSTRSEEFVKQITGMWHNQISRKNMAERASELIDGRGASRIADRLFKTFSLTAGRK